ncbi:uncharacterized protein LOC114277953 [Camellia sinensis]|uniref:uncharacterized protein LOC114277953 n=1 Tax=Camellia sinensis TaxID=4442 RepID=UPI001035D64E|nr:uncharacterized protein LOC114277953 [Camellia sinensis]
MKILCWNCRGLGNPRTVRFLQLLLKKEVPTMVFLVETKLDARAMERIRCKLGLQRCFTVDRVGLSGGLALLWVGEIQLQIKSFSRGHVDSIILSESGVASWCFTGFYGNPIASLRSDSWELLRRLQDQMHLPWLCAGDFNEILYAHEKSGMAARSQRQMDGFRQVLSDCDLADLGFEGAAFTWCNGRAGDGMIRERLDRCVVNERWLNSFPMARVYHLGGTSSDHLPILLDLEGVKAQMAHRPKYRKLYRFEAMWLREEDCEGIITREWHQDSNLSGVELVSGKLRAVASQLQAWNW